MKWRELRNAVISELTDAGISPAEAEARYIVEQASGYGVAEWLEISDLPPPARAERQVREMLRRRVAGEPLQYVLGGWEFRGFDLFVDRRVLIPRPETEYVVEVALEEAARSGLRRSRRRLSLVETNTTAAVVDIGTGSGAIAIALAAELPDVEVWATDVSEDALVVARANVSGCAATRVRLTDAGEWFDPLPAELRGAVRLLVSNPPYIAEHEVAELPEEVAGYEPRRALVSGPTGTEAIERLLDLAPGWLAPDATFVCEIAPHQADAMSKYARALGYDEVMVRDDLTGRARVLVARHGVSSSPMAADDQLDVDGMLERFRERAESVQRRGLPPVAGPERQQFLERAQLDFQDFAMLGDASWTFVDGVLTLTIDLRPR